MLLDMQEILPSGAVCLHELYKEQKNYEIKPRQLKLTEVNLTPNVNYVFEYLEKDLFFQFKIES